MIRQLGLERSEQKDRLRRNEGTLFCVNHFKNPAGGRDNSCFEN